MYERTVCMTGNEILCFRRTQGNRAFSHDVTAAMLVFQNKGMAAMMVYQTNPLGFDYFYANTVLCFSNPIWPLVT